jgi:hypothetical protein
MVLSSYHKPRNLWIGFDTQLNFSLTFRTLLKGIEFVRKS